MSNQRKYILLGIAFVLLLLRVGFSFQGSSGAKSFFSLGSANYELDPPEMRKMNLLMGHPVLDLAGNASPSETQKDPSGLSGRNPFLFGQPPAPPKVNLPDIVTQPQEVIVQEDSEVVQRFSGKLFGMTEFPESGVKTVLLSTSEDTMLLKEGELIDNRYQVKTINTEHVVIVDTKSGQELVLTFLDDL